MEAFKNIAIGFGVGIILILLLYFFWYTPSLKKEYDRGRADCEKQIDTVIIKGKDSVAYRDTSFHVSKPVNEIKDKDSLITLADKFDTTWISHKDTIGSHVEVNVTLKKDSSGKFTSRNSLIEWFQNLTHKDYEHTPDTVIVHVPHTVEVTVKEVNWLITGIAYVSGVISATILYFLAKK